MLEELVARYILPISIFAGTSLALLLRGVSADLAQSQGVFSSHDFDVLQHTFTRSASQTP